MKTALYLVMCLTTLSAQAPAAVDYAGIERDLQGIIATRKSGAPDASAKAEAFLAALWERSKTLQGEQRDACLIQLGSILNINGPRGYPSYGEQVLTRIRDEVPPSSPAWQVCPEMAAYVESMKPFQGTDYAARLESQGIPQVKQFLLIHKVEMAISTEDYPRAQAFLDRLKAAFPDTKELTEFAECIVTGQNTMPGQAAPAFEVPSLEDPKVLIRNADFKGRYLLLDFWGTWCAWCVQELPTTHKLYRAYKGKGLEILSLSTDKKPEDVRNFRAKAGTPMPWRHGFLGADRGHPAPILGAFGVREFPSLYLIGPDGKILARGNDLREKGLAKTLENFLGTSAN